MTSWNIMNHWWLKNCWYQWWKSSCSYIFLDITWTHHKRIQYLQYKLLTDADTMNHFVPLIQQAMEWSIELKADKMSYLCNLRVYPSVHCRHFQIGFHHTYEIAIPCLKFLHHQFFFIIEPHSSYIFLLVLASFLLYVAFPL